MGTLAVTEELHAKQQEAARKEAERAARKAPQDAAADAKGEAGEPASNKGSDARIVVFEQHGRGLEGPCAAQHISSPLVRRPLSPHPNSNPPPTPFRAHRKWV